jgi:hypothetical protein
MQRKYNQIEIQNKDLSAELEIPQHWCAEVHTLFNDSANCCGNTASVTGERMWRNGGMILSGESRSTGRKPVQESFCLPQIPLGLVWDYTLAPAVRSRQLTSSATTWPVLSRNN